MAYTLRKSARLYLQTMQDLPQQYPWLYIKFAEEGCHFIHCTNPYWAGIWTDLVIWKVLMRAFKSQRDVTRGRVMSKNVNLKWAHTMYRCTEISELTGNTNKTSEQHCEQGNTRIA